MKNLNEEKEGFDLKALIEDSKAVLFNPKDYYTKMPITGGFVEPIIKVLIYGAIIGIFSFIWSLTGLGASGVPSWLGGGVGFMALIGSIIFAVIGLFIGGLIMLIISAILGGNTDYETNVRVVASIMVISIISSALGFFDGINLYLSAIVSIAISLWGLYITYLALTLTLKAGEKGSKIFLIVIAVIVVITSFTGIAAKKALHNIGYNIENLSEEEQQDAALKLVEKMTGGDVNADDIKKVMKEQKKMLEDMQSQTAQEEFAIEMANGNTFDKVNFEKITECFNNMDDDNFFIILSDKDDFLKAAYSEKGYNVEYKENGTQYSSDELITKDKALKLFSKYLNSDKDWNKDIKWEKQ